LAVNLTDYTTEQLIQLLQSAQQEAVQIEAAIEPIESMERDERILLANEPKQKMSGGAKFGYYWLYWFLISIPFIIMQLAGAEGVVMYILGLPFGLGAYIAPFFIIRNKNNKIKQTYADWQTRLQQLHSQIEAQDAVLAQTIQRVADKINAIPEEYRYSFALDTMLGFLRNFRAAAWKECVDLYEQQKHRWLLEQNSNESVLLQRQAAQATERAASSAEAAAFFGAVTAVNTGILAHQATDR
jgi:hypothetical protein